MDYLSDLGERLSNTAVKVGDNLAERYEKSGLKENVNSQLDGLSKVSFDLEGDHLGKLGKDLTKKGK